MSEPEADRLTDAIALTPAAARAEVELALARAVVEQSGRRRRLVAAAPTLPARAQHSSLPSVVGPPAQVPAAAPGGRWCLRPRYSRWATNRDVLLYSARLAHRAVAEPPGRAAAAAAADATAAPPEPPPTPAPPARAAAAATDAPPPPPSKAAQALAAYRALRAAGKPPPPPPPLEPEPLPLTDAAGFYCSPPDDKTITPTSISLSAADTATAAPALRSLARDAAAIAAAAAPPAARPHEAPGKWVFPPERAPNRGGPPLSPPWWELHAQVWLSLPRRQQIRLDKIARKQETTEEGWRLARDEAARVIDKLRARRVPWLSNSSPW